jgi:hypothetical protein
MQDKRCKTDLNNIEECFTTCCRNHLKHVSVVVQVAVFVSVEDGVNNVDI